MPSKGSQHFVAIPKVHSNAALMYGPTEEHRKGRLVWWLAGTGVVQVAHFPLAQVTVRMKLITLTLKNSTTSQLTLRNQHVGSRKSVYTAHITN